jgi:hypothetical protein
MENEAFSQDEISRDDIIEMARQAGATEIGHKPPAFHFYLKDLEAFAKLVDAKATAKAVEREREACAKLCDELAELNRFSETDSMWEWGECAAAIRARGNV